MQSFTFSGPLGPLECIVNSNKGSRKAVLIMAHGFRGSREGGGRAAELAQYLSAYCDVIRFNFTGTRPMSDQVLELRAVVAMVQRLEPEAEIYLLGRSLGGAASIIVAATNLAVKRLILWSAPNDLPATFRHVLGADYDKLAQGESVVFDDERGHCELTPDWLTDLMHYNLSELLLAWNGRPVLILHCQGDEVVLAKQAINNTLLLGDCVNLQLFPKGDHSIGDYAEQTKKIIGNWLK